MTAARREGCYRCERCGSPHARILVHEDGGFITADDRPDLTRRILSAYAAIDGHASLGDTMNAICSRPSTTDGRTRETRAWREQMLETYWLSTDLAESGLLRMVHEPCSDYSWGFQITAAGRAHLAWTQAA